MSGQPPFFTDKFTLVNACHLSFFSAGDCDRHYFLDNCPVEWDKHFEFAGTVHRGIWGKLESLHNVFDFARNLSGDLLFLEDDYLWRPGTLPTLVEGLDRFGMVSPYDHPDFYHKEGITCTEVYRLGDHLWRWCPTNTHTFAVRSDILREHFDAFRNNNLHDWQMFTELQIEGVRLYTPLLSLATHLVEGKLALGVDWAKVAGGLDFGS